MTRRAVVRPGPSTSANADGANRVGQPVTNRVTEIFTIGHSTHTAEQFLKLLRLHNIAQLADVRTVPRSRRHPHFAGEALDNFLRAEGIIYRHFPSLGGLRKPHSNSVNTAWQHPSFR
ncbi:MAG TPA: DUF488 domain-containing protein, partial [Vicinamibacterales bacterium]